MKIAMKRRVSAAFGGVVAASGIFLATASSALAQTPAFPSDSTIRAILMDRLVTHRSYDMVVGLVDHGSHRIIPMGDQIPGRRAIDANSVFEIGSITKVFTGTILADMSLKGKVSLEDPVQKFLPANVNVPQRNGKEITLLDLSTQSSGLPRLPANLQPKDFTNPYASYTIQNLYEFLNAYTLPRDIGAQYEYSNLGVGLLGVALASRGGVPYETLVHQYILDPLGMKDTGIRLTPSQKQRLVTGHGPDMKEAANWDMPAFEGAGALRSTMNDMLKFLDANLSDTGPLAPAMALAREPRRNAGMMHIGLNWHIVGTGDNAIVWHNGGTGGYTSFIAFNRASGRGVVILTASAKSSDDIGMHLMNPAIPLMSK